MALNPLAPVTDYESKLSRIFWFTSLSAATAIWLLRDNIPVLDLLLERVDFRLRLGENLVLPGGYLLPALAVGLTSRVFRIHDRLSDWLGIRERFDVDVIIAGLAEATGVELAGTSDERLVQCRRTVMSQAFYPFTSSKQPQIDQHVIHQALDWWSWFWVVLEATFLFVMTGLTLVAFGVYALGVAVTFGVLTAAIVALPIIRGQCRRYAIAQVGAIVSDSGRAQRVREVLGCLTTGSASQSPAWHPKAEVKRPAMLAPPWAKYSRE